MTRLSPVAAELLAFGLELESQGAAQVGESFTGHAEADALLEDRPEAFLFGMLFTQGIPAERAWMGPWLLRERLGHLDLVRLAEEPDAVREALQRPPMLHRFKNTLPRWISAAARRVLDDYEGDASLIWAPGTSVPDVVQRLSEFQGVGRKKAVMGAEILVRHFGVALVGREFGQVAYDVHVRRVFLRTGLAASDAPGAIEAAAAAVNPGAPGVLDLAAWLVGRDTCRPTIPRCDACRLGATCPRLTSVVVEGVGGRGRTKTGAETSCPSADEEAPTGDAGHLH